MISEIISALCLFLVLLGFIAAVYYIILRIIRPKKNGGYTIVIAASPTDSDVADRLCSEYMRMELLGELSTGAIAVVDCGMSCEERRRCEDFRRESKNIFICCPCELERLITDRCRDTQARQ